MEQFDSLLETVRLLRGEGGCPWDKKQTLSSMKSNFLEEVYELADAIDTDNSADIREELGDVFFNLVFFAVIGEESERFKLSEILSEINKKLISRHPHVFADAEVSGADEVTERWEEIKAREKTRESIYDGLPKSLPAIVRALQIQRKAANVGFDWSEITPVLDKVSEELDELKSEIKKGRDVDKLKMETGDLLFSIVNLSRFLMIDPADCLNRTNDKFIARFRWLEKRLRDEARDIRKCTLEELDLIWEDSKEFHP